MKTVKFILVWTLFTSLAGASDWNLIVVPIPENLSALQRSGFQLFHRGSDFWIGSLPETSRLPEGGRILNKYNPGNGDVFALSLFSPRESEKLTGRVNVLYLHGKEAVIQATLPQRQSLPPIGAEWTMVTLIPKPIISWQGGISETDDFSPFVEGMVNQVSQEEYSEYLQTLEDYVTRNTYTTNCDQAAAWILSQFQSFGLNAYYDYFLIGGSTKRNVVGELLGTVYPDSVYFITAHYDATIGQPWQAEPVAPGADDNGSGTACVLECARVLSMYNFEKTIRFVAFAGEEQGLVGSMNYVQHLQEAGALVAGSFNYDMIAYSSGSPPYGLNIITDLNPVSQAMAAKISEAANTFVPAYIAPNVIVSPGSASSDHWFFWQAGWPATFSIHAASYPYYHTANDLVVNCDLGFGANATRTALAALADLAEPLGGGTQLSGSVSGVWAALGNPYSVVDSIWVPPDSTLMIEPGVLVIFDGHYSFKILQDAVLQAIGTVQQPITFMPLDPEVGWGGIRFLNASDSSRLEFCRLKYGLAAGVGTDAWGGGIYCENSSPTIDHSLITNCQADTGGAIACNLISNPVITSCTLAENVATSGSAIYCSYNSPIIHNSILWNDSSPEIDGLGGYDPQVTYSDVQGGWAGEGNLDADPLFVNADLGNYHLQSTVGSYSYGVWLPDSSYSPCMDAGDPASAYDQEPEPNGDRIDMGAYGNTAQASYSDDDPHYAYGEVSGVWTSANDPMNVIGDIFVPAGEQLTIMPGLQIIFQGHYTFRILDGAALLAVGTIEDSISFTANDPEEGWGGIRFLSASDSSRLEYCHLSDGRLIGSSEDAYGGGIYCSIGGITVWNSLIENCSATWGGAIYCANSNSLLEANVLTGNTANSGGAIYIDQSDLLIHENVFSGNEGSNGGAVTLWFSTAQFDNNLFYDNSVNGYGGAIYSFNSDPSLINNTFAGNSATQGGGIYCIGNLSPTLVNCILWDNSPTQLALGASSNPSVTYSDLQGGWSGEGNLDLDPVFVVGPLSDYQLSDNSPCVDAGNPDPQYNDPEDPANPGFALWPALGTVRNDMGAYGGSQASGWVGVAPDMEVSLPEEYSLAQNYPNPFNAQTVIPIALPQRSQITVTLYNLMGQRVATVYQGVQNAGQGRLRFDASLLPSGVYFYRVEASGLERGGKFKDVGKMLLLK